MKKLILLLLILLVLDTSAMSPKKDKKRAIASTPHNYQELEFIQLKQFPNKSHKLKFDLSGLAQGSDGTMYAISDKETYPFIYVVDWKNKKLQEHLPFGIKDKIDIEAVDICDNTFYISNEKNNKFYTLRKGEETTALDIDLSDLNLKGGLFAGNDGFEGMAIDCQNQIMYALKEMLPRFILTIDLKTNKVLKKWNIPHTDSFDYTDAKFENGYLYILERTGMLVAKVDPKTEKVISKFSYRNMEKEPGYLFGPANNNIGEALELTADEIWIGFDNNGLKASEKSQKELGLKGRDPLIMRFKRPANF